MSMTILFYDLVVNMVAALLVLYADLFTFCLSTPSPILCCNSVGQMKKSVWGMQCSVFFREKNLGGIFSPYLAIGYSYLIRIKICAERL